MKTLHQRQPNRRDNCSEHFWADFHLSNEQLYQHRRYHMSRIRLAVFVLVCAILSAALPTFAQDALPLTQTFTSPDGQITLSYPDGWQTETHVATVDLLDMTVGNSEATTSKDAFLGGSTI